MRKKDTASSHPRKRRILMLMIGAALLSPRPGAADQIYWSGSTGDWSDANNWADHTRKDAQGNYLSVVPGPSDYATIQNGGIPQIASSGANAGINIDGGSSLNILSGGALVSGSVFVGETGTGNIQQFNGTHTINGGLTVGASANSSGQYNLLAGSLQVINGDEAVGWSGAGVFTQLGGTNAVGNLSLGDFGGSTGTYNLSGTGSLIVTSTLVGGGGTGSFNQMGGSHVVGDWLEVGEGGSVACTYTLSAGSLTVGSGVDVGHDGVGIFNHSGGTHTVNGLLRVGESLGGYDDGVGTYNLSGTGVLNVNGNEYIGDGEDGTFTQSGGTHTVTGAVFVDSDISNDDVGVGTYSLRGGTLKTGAIVVGPGGTFTNSAALTLTGSAVSWPYYGGNFTQASSGTLNLQINGKTSGQFGQLITGTGGTASLNGNLGVTVAIGVPLMSGDAFQVITASSLTGIFNNGKRTVQATDPNNSSVGQFNVSYANNSVTLIYQPLLMLANLSNNIYHGNVGYGAYSYANNIAGSVDPQNLGYLANAYVTADGSQVVVAIRGTNLTDPVALIKNVAADVSFGGATPSPLFTSEVKDAATFLQNVRTAYPNANITLTGHSLGGAVAQLLGEASGFDTIAFDAPGAQQLYSSLADQLQFGKWGSPVPGQFDTDYRLYGDQVSLFGQPIGNTITITNPSQAPTGLNLVMGGFQYIANAHDLPTLISQIPPDLNNLRVSTIPAGQSPELNVAQALQGLITGTPQGNSIYQFTFSVTDIAARFLQDPAGGTDFKFLENAGSPNLASITFPTLDGVSLYSVRYDLGGAWSSYASVQPGNEYDLPAGVDGVEFSALDSSGDTVTLSDFLFQTSYGSTGEVSGTLYETSVPEPEPAGAFILAAAAALIRRPRRSEPS